MKYSLVRPAQRSMKPLATQLILGLSFLSVFPGALSAQDHLKPEDLQVIRGTPIENENQHMLMNYFLSQARAVTEKRLARLEALQSQADIKTWSDANREEFLRLIGGLPGDRTPLNARVVGEIPREGYVIRKIIFESLPEFYVTANLYVPTVGKSPYPAILSPCGHSENGKAYEVYQHLFIGLVKRGYVVLTYDPLGQGERVQYWDFLANRRRFDFNQHGMAGIQEYLLGKNLARYFIWDGMRALDYLTSLPEVDASRIGVTGSSGGGTLTTYIAMLDSRVKAASVVTFITSIPKKIENRANDAEADPEQDIAGLLAAGIDHTEFLGMIAPRPVLIGAATRDFFPIEGTRKTFGEAQEIYKKLGVPDHIKMAEFDHRHMYSQPLREATYAWFDRWLKGIENEVQEPAIVTEKDDVLQCTLTGQVETSLGGKTVADFNRADAERLERNLEAKRGKRQINSEIDTKIKERLGLPADMTGQHSAPPQKSGEIALNDLVIEKFLLAPEEGIVIPTRVILPKDHRARLPAVVYLRDRNGDGDSPSLFEAWASRERMVVVADVRGFGETMSAPAIPNSHLDYFDPRDGMDADFTFASFFLGHPLLGMRVRDAQAVIDFLRARPEVDTSHITLVGKGWAGVVALFTAAIDPRISRVAVEGTPVSFGEIAKAHLYNQPVSLMIPGILQDFDLPDVLASLAPRPLLVLNPEDAMTRKMSGDLTRHAAEFVRQTYRRAGAEGNFAAKVAPLESEAREALLKWVSGN
ncbi:MAG TPA: acetylxylan esterase [Terriglobia bacterium]|nr:acetylxylan esterase [Terriglobia bacterium]